MKLLMMREEGVLLETLESFGDKLNELHKEKIVEAIEVAANSVTLITNTQPQSSIRVAIMFVP